MKLVPGNVTLHQRIREAIRLSLARELAEHAPSLILDAPLAGRVVVDFA
jgi:hypothetical protein